MCMMKLRFSFFWGGDRWKWRPIMEEMEWWEKNKVRSEKPGSEREREREGVKTSKQTGAHAGRPPCLENYTCENFWLLLSFILKSQPHPGESWSIATQVSVMQLWPSFCINGTSLQHVHRYVIPLIGQTLKNTPELILQLALKLKLVVIQFWP